MVKKYGVILEGKMVTVCVYGREEGMECGGGGGGGGGGEGGVRRAVLSPNYYGND